MLGTTPALGICRRRTTDNPGGHAERLVDHRKHQALQQEEFSRLMQKVQADKARAKAATKAANTPVTGPAPAAAAAAAAAAATVRRALEAPAAPACTPISALCALRSGDSFIPCWCWQARETPPSHAA